MAGYTHAVQGNLRGDQTLLAGFSLALREEIKGFGTVTALCRAACPRKPACAPFSPRDSGLGHHGRSAAGAERL